MEIIEIKVIEIELKYHGLKYTLEKSKLGNLNVTIIKSIIG